MSPTDVALDLLASMIGWLVGPYVLAFAATALALVAAFVAFDSGIEGGRDDADGPIEVRE